MPIVNKNALKNKINSARLNKFLSAQTLKNTTEKITYIRNLLKLDFKFISKTNSNKQGVSIFT